MFTITRAAVGAAAVLTAVAAGAAVPAYAGQSTDTIDCEGHPVTIRVNDNNSSDHGGWASVQVLEGGSGHLTPVRFSGVLTDTATNTVIGEYAVERGRGHTPRSAELVECTTSFTATVADFVEDLGSVPPGTSLEDPVVFELVATVIAKG